MKKTILYSLLVLMFMQIPASALTGSKNTFKADLYYQAPGGREQYVMRIYRSADKLRMERIDGGKGTGIARYDKKVVWGLNNRQRTYWQIAMAPVPVIHPMDLDGTTLKRTILGRERQSGVMCNKVRVQYKDPHRGRSSIATAWYAKNLGIYVRIEKADGSALVMRNIRFGPQPGRLFEVPRHYRLRPTTDEPEYRRRPIPSHAVQGPPWFGRPPMHRPNPGPSNERGIPVLRDGRLFHNSDFEDGTLHNWSADGEAFRFQPTKADNPAARRSPQPSRHQKHYWIGTYEKYGGRLRERPGRIQGDRPKGTLTSIPFVVTHERIEFLVGGGNRPSETYVALLINGKEVRKTSGNDSETMVKRTWHVRQHAGRKARILIADKASRRWGHINADDFRYAGRALVDVRAAASRPRYDRRDAP